MRRIRINQYQADLAAPAMAENYAVDVRD